MNENLNLVELLKDVPKGTRFYCLIFGDVTFEKVRSEKSFFPIRFMTENGNERGVTIDGNWLNDTPNGECVFFPSKEQRDWSIWAKEKDEKKKQLLPVDTPVMVDAIDGEGLGHLWTLRYYAESNKCFFHGEKSKDNYSISEWDIIIPFDKFDPNNIEESLKHNIIELI